MSSVNVKGWPKLTSADEFRFLADLVLKRSGADHTVVNLHDLHTGTTRFANSRIVQGLPRYIVWWTPRVYGNWPGSARSLA